jgi:hypothetical protein
MEHCDDCAQKYVIEDAGYRPLCVPCQIARAYHPQVMTRYGFPVDEDLKELVEMLNDNDIRTGNSCQNQGPKLNNVTWIDFCSYANVKKLLLLMKAGDRNLYDYFQQFGKWSICLDDDSDDKDVSPSFGVRFPAKDLANVTRQFAKLAVPRTNGHESL